ncbi:HAD family hydrolase [Spirochaeta thermophila]|uniref:Haloacid dehalogenase domain protein hydrolase n=1 Tax=Winmispira thermophila (strain ATCC 49972 / DSM 6192 / RI 19.B1) TaxID=665571 RepID=E0RPS5_WINT6|nr:HAD family hydrolase [Spirochaeta thermophila]ADN01389.1 hypothetical protein STHERM_c04170 [Spirochaeta thermophila DSM 6192]
MAARTMDHFTREKEFFIGIDSDGCVFDTMELKHKECFCPEFVYHFSLQSVSRYARQVWEFVNLYSTTRGINRFLAVIRAVDLLAAHPEASKRSPHLPSLTALRRWVQRETKLGMHTLTEELERNPDPELALVHRWSQGVNEAIARMVQGGIPPFPYVKESLALMQEKADTLVVSQTPFEALEREWTEQGIHTYVKAIAGQEVGNKARQIAAAVADHYPPSHRLMIGDAPGDLEAARANEALFFPIIPGQEEASWEELHREGLPRFFEGRFEGEYQHRLLERFERSLPSTPPWEAT